MPYYFRNELPTARVYLPQGKPIEFWVGIDGFGYYATTNGYEVTELRNCQSRGVGGVMEVTAEVYDEAEKKTSEQPQSGSQGRRQVIGMSHKKRSSFLRQAAVTNSAAIVGVMANGKSVSAFAQPQRTEGLDAKPQFVKPKVGKIPPMTS